MVTQVAIDGVFSDNLFHSIRKKVQQKVLPRHPAQTPRRPNVFYLNGCCLNRFFPLHPRFHSFHTLRSLCAFYFESYLQCDRNPFSHEIEGEAFLTKYSLS